MTEPTDHKKVAKFRLKSQLDSSDSLCLAVGENSDILMKACESADSLELKSMLWSVDRRGRIWSKKEVTRCLSPLGKNIKENTPLGLRNAPCLRSSWFLNSEGQIRYGGSPFMLGFDRSGIDKRPRLIPLSNAPEESKWVFDRNIFNLSSE